MKQDSQDEGIIFRILGLFEAGFTGLRNNFQNSVDRVGNVIKRFKSFTQLMICLNSQKILNQDSQD